MSNLFDSDAWYQVTESRVDFNSSLQVAGTGLVMAAAGPKTYQFWQIFYLGNGTYSLRNKQNGLHQQLGTCYAAAETDPSRTQPCMRDSAGDDSQKWTITQWGDGTYKLINNGNGTGLNLDCHPGVSLLNPRRNLALKLTPHA
jgi:Ricin-type beta-trefoil lectin domain-like